MVVEFVRLPDVPVITTLDVPRGAELLAENVTVLVLVVLLGLNEAVTPLGRPEAVRLTLSLKPLYGVTVIVLEPLPLCAKVRLLGDADSVKFGVDAGQLFTRLAAFTLPIPVAKSQPAVVPYAGKNELSEVESTPCVPDGL